MKKTIIAALALAALVAVSAFLMLDQEADPAAAPPAATHAPDAVPANAPETARSLTPEPSAPAVADPPKTDAPLRSTAESDDNSSMPTDDKDNAFYISRAYERASEAMQISDASAAIVEYTSEGVVVTFPVPSEKTSGRPPYPGPEYIARVILDRESGEVRQLLVAQ